MDSEDINRHYQHCDVRAEVVCADLVSGGEDIDCLVIKPAGIFNRRYRKDILHTETSNAGSGGAEVVLTVLNVSREGIYDSLPNGLFYQPIIKPNDSLDNKIQEIRKQRTEESEARKFFSVLEREFNKCKVLIELQERKSIFGMSDTFSSDLYSEIWPELQQVPQKFHKFLYQILPVSHKCRGNISLSALLLGIALGERVFIHVHSEPRMEKSTMDSNVLGSRYMGTDFVIGDYYPEYSPLYEVVVGPVAPEKVTDYMAGGDAESLLRFLSDYFIPMDADFKMNIQLQNEGGNLSLQQYNNYSYLGYNSTI